MVYPKFCLQKAKKVQKKTKSILLVFNKPKNLLSQNL